MSQISNSVFCPLNAESDIESDVTLNQDSATLVEAETVINTHNTSSQVEGTEALKDLLTDEYCHICEAVLLFESQRTSHYEGKKHAQKVRLYLQSKKAQENPDKTATVLQAGASMDKQKFCELCNMVFSSAVVAKSHYEGKIHAKNLRKVRPLDAMQKVGVSQPDPPQVLDKPEAVEDDIITSGLKVTSPAAAAATVTTQEVDLNDPTRHCRLCAASFNNPQMAQQHYSGRKHQRNQSRQQLLEQLAEDGDAARSLTCPICSVSLSSVEVYQAHMQGNKHHIKEKKVADLCKSQKKMYDSFQDELADYMAVQRARGLQPKAGMGDLEREHEGKQEEEKTVPPPPPLPLPHPPPHLRPPPPPAVPPPSVYPPSLFSIRFSSPPPRLAQPRFAPWTRGVPPRPPFWDPGFNGPRGPPGRRPARGRTPDWSSSSSSWSDSSYSSSSGSSSSSSSSSSDSEDSRERRRRRRRRRKLKERERKDREKERRGRRREARDGEEEEEEKGEEREGMEKRARRRERKHGEGDREDKHEKNRNRRRRERERRHRKESPDEEREARKRRRERQTKRPHEEDEGEEEGAKRRREMNEGMQVGETESRGEDTSRHVDVEQLEDKTNGQGAVAPTESIMGDGADRKERQKTHRHKKEKKKKERTEEVDTRTEEERLWDETILGIF